MTIPIWQVQSDCQLILNLTEGEMDGCNSSPHLTGQKFLLILSDNLEYACVYV